MSAMSSSRNIRQSTSNPPRSTTSGLRYHRSQLSNELNGLNVLNFEQSNFNNHTSSNIRTPNHESSTMNSNRNSSTPTSNNSNDNEISSDSMRHSLTWKLINVSGIVPPARSGAASVIVGSKLYMFG